MGETQRFENTAGLVLQNIHTETEEVGGRHHLLTFAPSRSATLLEWVAALLCMVPNEVYLEEMKKKMRARGFAVSLEKTLISIKPGKPKDGIKTVFFYTNKTDIYVCENMPNRVAIYKFNRKHCCKRLSKNTHLLIERNT